MHGNPAAVVVRDPVTNRQAESRPGAFRLGREERIEDFLLNVDRDAGPGVGDLKLHPFVAGRHRPDRNDPTALHRGQRLLGVDQ